MRHSLEQLDAITAARGRDRAAFLLEIGQVCGLALAGGQPWQRKQHELIERSKT